MIVGIAGKAASGKTTAAHYMADHLQGEVRIVPMAQLLRDEVETFLRTIGSANYVPLVYGCQDDKVQVFYVDYNGPLQPVGAGHTSPPNMPTSRIVRDKLP